MSGRVELPYISDYISKNGDFDNGITDGSAFIILEGVNYGLIESIKSIQIELLQQLTKNSIKEVDPTRVLEVTNRQMDFVKKIWKENVVGFVDLFDQDGNLITKEMVEKDAVLLQDMLSN
ncbi:hypothetical protein, partial [Borrelia persica]|uniref:hypothetical protein n=1 Tax=Borrelia persica TaxID=44448 RepID=UPI00057160A6